MCVFPLIDVGFRLECCSYNHISCIKQCTSTKILPGSYLHITYRTVIVKWYEVAITYIIHRAMTQDCTHMFTKFLTDHEGMGKSVHQQFLFFCHCRRVGRIDCREIIALKRVCLAINQDYSFFIVY